MQVIVRNENSTKKEINQEKNSNNKGKSQAKYQPQVLFREWSPNVHVQDEEMKRAYRVVVEGRQSSQLINDEEINDLISNMRQPMNNEQLFMTMQRSQRITQEKSLRVYEPMLFQTDYHFSDKKNLQEFQEIQKRTKMIRRKQSELETKEKNSQKQNLLMEIDKMRSFFIKNFKLRGKIVTDKEMKTIAGYSMLDFEQLKHLQDKVIKAVQQKEQDGKILEKNTRDKSIGKQSQNKKQKNQSQKKSVNINKQENQNLQQEIKEVKNEYQAPQQQQEQQTIKQIEEISSKEFQNAKNINELVQEQKQEKNITKPKIEFKDNPQAKNQDGFKSRKSANITLDKQVAALSRKSIQPKITQTNQQEKKQTQTIKKPQQNQKNLLVINQTKNTKEINQEKYSILYEPLLLDNEFYIINLQINTQETEPVQISIRNTKGLLVYQKQEKLFTEKLEKLQIEFQAQKETNINTIIIYDSEQQQISQGNLETVQNQDIYICSSKFLEEIVKKDIENIKEQLMLQTSLFNTNQPNLQQIEEAVSPNESRIQNLLSSFYKKQVAQAIQELGQEKKGIHFNDFVQRISIDKTQTRKSKVNGRRTIQSVGTLDGQQVNVIEFEPILVGDHFVTQQIIQQKDQENNIQETQLITKKDDGKIIDQKKILDLQSYYEDLTNAVIEETAQGNFRLQILDKKKSIMELEINREEVVDQQEIVQSEVSDQQKSQGSQGNQQEIKEQENSEGIRQIKQRMSKYSTLVVFQELASSDFDHPLEVQNYKEERRRMSQHLTAPNDYEIQEKSQETKHKSLLQNFQDFSLTEKEDTDFWKDFKSFCQEMKFNEEYVDAIMFATLFYFKIKRGNKMLLGDSFQQDKGEFLREMESLKTQLDLLVSKHNKGMLDKNVAEIQERISQQILNSVCNEVKENQNLYKKDVEKQLEISASLLQQLNQERQRNTELEIKLLNKNFSSKEIIQKFQQEDKDLEFLIQNLCQTYQQKIEQIQQENSSLLEQQKQMQIQFSQFLNNVQKLQNHQEKTLGTSAAEQLVDELIIIKILYKKLTNTYKGEQRIYPLEFVMKNLDYFKEINQQDFKVNKMFYQQNLKEDQQTNKENEETQFNLQRQLKIQKRKKQNQDNSFNKIYLKSVQSQNQSLLNQKEMLQSQNQEMINRIQELMLQSFDLKKHIRIQQSNMDRLQQENQLLHKENRQQYSSQQRATNDCLKILNQFAQMQSKSQHQFFNIVKLQLQSLYNFSTENQQEHKIKDLQQQFYIQQISAVIQQKTLIENQLQQLEHNNYNLQQQIQQANEKIEEFDQQEVFEQINKQIEEQKKQYQSLLQNYQDFIQQNEGQETQAVLQAQKEQESISQIQQELEQKISLLENQIETQAQNFLWQISDKQKRINDQEILLNQRNSENQQNTNKINQLENELKEITEKLQEVPQDCLVVKRSGLEQTYDFLFRINNVFIPQINSEEELQQVKMHIKKIAKYSQIVRQFSIFEEIDKSEYEKIEQENKEKQEELNRQKMLQEQQEKLIQEENEQLQRQKDLLDEEKEIEEIKQEEMPQENKEEIQQEDQQEISIVQNIQETQETINPVENNPQSQHTKFPKKSPQRNRKKKIPQKSQQSEEQLTSAELLKRKLLSKKANKKQLSNLIHQSLIMQF